MEEGTVSLTQTQLLHYLGNCIAVFHTYQLKLRIEYETAEIAMMQYATYLHIHKTQFKPASNVNS